MADTVNIKGPAEVAAEVAALQERYHRLGHAMQTGVLFEMPAGDERMDLKACSPKHLRVGVNTALADNGALARLLIAKGLITELELWTSLVEMMEIEVRSYEDRLSAKGTKVTLL